MLVNLLEIGVLEVLRDLALAELVLAARLGDERHVSVFRQRIAETLSNEDLPRRVRQMLLGADDVADLHVVVIHDIGQVVEARAVGTLNDVVLLRGPLEPPCRRGCGR